MPYERDIFSELGHDEGVVHFIRIHFRQNHGQIFEYVVQYEAEIGDKRFPILRFDNAHGFPHRDLISPSGLQSKTSMPNLTNAEALSFAIKHIREQFREYFAWYQHESQKTHRRT